MTSDKIAYTALGFLIGAIIIGLAVKFTTDRAWKAEIANSKPTLVIQHDTVQSPPIAIVRRLNPIVKHDTVRVVNSSDLDSTASYWARAILNFWLSLGYDAQSAYNMQDSLTIERGFEIKNENIGYMKVRYLPLSDFILTVDEIRPPIISSDTTKTYPPIVIPRTFFDELIQYGGYVLFVVFATITLLK